MILSELGNAAMRCWDAIETHFPMVAIDEFIVLPDHVHGLVYLVPNGDGDGGLSVFPGSPMDPGPSGVPVETHDHASLQMRVWGGTTGGCGGQTRQKPYPPTVAAIIRGFKIGVTKFARQNDLPFGWQSRFHDRIVRNPDELNRIRQYIRNNVAIHVRRLAQ